MVYYEDVTFNAENNLYQTSGIGKRRSFVNSNIIIFASRYSKAHFIYELIDDQTYHLT